MTGSILVSDDIAGRYAAELEHAAPGAPLAVLGPDGLDVDPETVEAAYFSNDMYPERAAQSMMAMAQTTNLRWLHSFSAGVDHPAFLALQERGVRITTSAGAHATPIAHTVAMYLLALSRDFPAWIDAQRRKTWERHENQELQDKVLGIVGMGHIGAEVAKLGAALDMRVIGMRRTPRGDEPCETWPNTRLHDLLQITDYLVLAMALNDESEHTLNADTLAQLRPEAYVINVGRGPLIDEPALIAALQEGRIAGAALDVFEEEPLPAESPLWGLPNVIVTPHNSGGTPGNFVRATEIFLDNLGRYVRGEPLRNEMPSPAAEAS